MEVCRLETVHGQPSLEGHIFPYQVSPIKYVLLSKMHGYLTPANGASQGNYFLSKNHKLAVYEAKAGFQKQLCQPKLQTFFQRVFGSV